jgi:hypothetical protein
VVFRRRSNDIEERNRDPMLDATVNVVELPVPTVQLGREPSVAVAGELQHTGLNGIAERNVTLGLRGLMWSRAELTHRQTGKLLLQGCHELMPGLDWSRCKALAAFSTASWPQTRSSSAICVS